MPTEVMMHTFDSREDHPASAAISGAELQAFLSTGSQRDKPKLSIEPCERPKSGYIVVTKLFILR